MEIKKNKKGVVIDFQGNRMKFNRNYGIKVTGYNDEVPLEIKNAFLIGGKIYPIGFYKKVVKVGIIYNVATYIALKIMEG